MTEQDRKTFNSELVALAAVFDKALSRPVLDAYFDALKEFPLPAIKAAFQQAISGSKFFPKPVEIRESLEGNDNDRASYAWAAFLEAAASGGYSSVKFLDSATATAMDVVFGGWIQACRLLAAGWVDNGGKEHGGCSDEMVSSYKNHFLKIYAAARKAPRQVETYRAGLSELSMREGGGEWKSKMGVLVQPVLLVGEKQSKEIKLPFDVAAGALTSEAMAKLIEGPRAVIEYASTFAPKALAAKPEQRALKAAPELPATKEEIAAIMAEARAKHPSSPYLRLVEGAANQQEVA